MPRDISRVLRAFASQPWFIDPRQAEKIVAVLMLRAQHLPRDPEFQRWSGPNAAAEGDQPPASARRQNIKVLTLQGIIAPRATMVDDISGPPAASLERFIREFDQAAQDRSVGAIVINIDSPGGQVDLVPETAARIRAAHDPSRPIIAVANTLAASAAYWIATAADELVVTESGEVGSVGVWSMHEDVSVALAQEGISVTLISEGPRKVEGNPFEPLGADARAHLQETTRHYYDMFVRDVAAFRGVDQSVVRADPNKSDQHFGGGRTYPARVAVRLGMADRVESLDSVLRSLQTGKRPIRNRRAEMYRRRLALI